MLELDHGANENACVAEHKAKCRRLGTILSGARGIVLDTVSTTRGMAERELKGNAWKIYTDDWKQRGERELPGGTAP